MKALQTLVDILRDDALTNADVDWASVVNAIEQGADEISCTRHPLGFLHLELTPLVEVDQGERFRLHYWPNAGTNADAIGSLHDHVWHLSSIVAAGHLQDRTLRPILDDSGDYDGIRITYSDKGNSFRPIGRFSLSFERELTVRPGSIYRVPARVIHDSAVLEAPSVTFVLARDDEIALSVGPLVLQRRGGLIHGTPTRVPVDVASAVKMIRQRLLSN